MAAISRGLAAGLVCLATACSNTPEVAFHAPADYPERLSDWGLMTLSGDAIALSPSTELYALNAPLFSDYAHKLRALYLPGGTKAQYRDFDAFELPVGTIISKLFFYRLDAAGNIALDDRFDGDPASIDPASARLIETRLLVRQADGWDALPYIWRGDDAYLSITGALLELPLSDGETLNYLVPSRNQCASCHATDHTAGHIQPIGIKARHLNRAHPVTGRNQLLAWQAAGRLQGLPAPGAVASNADPSDPNHSIAHRARSYLDINCGHCHNPAGPADTSGLMLDYQSHAPMAMGVCKPPIAAGRGSGGRLFSIVPGNAEASILTFRMSTTDPATMMPELGRSRVHSEGLALISDWVASLPGECR